MKVKAFLNVNSPTSQYLRWTVDGRHVPNGQRVLFHFTSKVFSHYDHGTLNRIYAGNSLETIDKTMNTM